MTPPFSLEDLSTDELLALKNGNYAALSTETLTRLKSLNSPSNPEPQRKGFLERIINSQNNQKNMSFGDMALDAVSRSTSPTRVMGDVADVIFGASEPVTPSMQEEAKKRYEERSAGSSDIGKSIGAGLTGFADTASLGAFPYLEGAIQTLSGERPNPQGGVWDNLERNIAIQKGVQNLRREDNPVSSIVGDVAGLIKGPSGKFINAITPTSETMKSIPFLKKMLTRTLTGGLGNAATGQVLSNPKTNEDSLKRAGIDFALGGGSNALIGGMADAVAGLGKGGLKYRVPQKIYASGTDLGKEGAENPEMIDILLREGAVGSSKKLQNLSEEKLTEIGAQLKSMLSGKEANYDDIVARIGDFEKKFASGERGAAQQSLQNVIDEFSGLFKSKQIPGGAVARPSYQQFKTDFLSKYGDPAPDVTLSAAPSGVMQRPSFQDFKAQMLKGQPSTGGKAAYVQDAELDKDLIKQIKSTDELFQIVKSEPDLFVRWSRGPKFDLNQINSTDKTTGLKHSGLSAVDLDPSWSPAYLAKRIKEYQFLKMNDPQIKGYIYKGGKIGVDSDAYPTIKIKSVIGRLSDEFEKDLMHNSERDLLVEKLLDSKKLYEKVTDPIAKKIYSEQIEKLTKEIEGLTPPNTVKAVPKAAEEDIHRLYLQQYPEEFIPLAGTGGKVQSVSKTPTPTEDDIVRMYLQQYPDEMIQLPGKEGPKTVNLEDLNFEKSKLARSARRLYENPDILAQTKRGAQKELADASRAEIEKLAPEVRDTLARYHAYDELGDSLDYAGKKSFAQKIGRTPVSDIATSGGGFLAGGPIGALTALVGKKGLESTTAQTNVASFLYKLLNSMKNAGSYTGSKSTMAIPQLMTNVKSD